MAWIGKIIGGAIGGLVGGPVGIAVGAGLGHALDAASDGAPAPGAAPGAPDLDVGLRYQDDGLGYAALLEFEHPWPAGALVVARAMHAGGQRYLRAPEPWADDDGGFVAVAPVVGQAAYFYLPYGVLDYAVPGDYLLQIGGLVPSGKDEPHLVGVSDFVLPLPRPPGATRVDVLRPLVDLAMQVVRADGQVLGEEIRAVKEYFRAQFDLAGPELLQLRDALKAPDEGGLEEQVEAVQRRFPSLSGGDLLGFLGGVAHSDGDVDPAEVDVIRRVGLALDATEREIAALLDELDLRASDAPHTVLGIDRNAPREEIRRAYREKMRSYHPDRVAELPAEFQALAHEKSLEIRAAYDAMMAGAAG